MKKNVLVLIMFFMLILNSCESMNSSLLPVSDPTESNVSENSVSEESDMSSFFDVLKGGVYQNDELSFQLTFPESWKNYYTIDWNDLFTDKNIKECIRISFYGESKVSRKYDEENDITRIPLFYICTETYLEAYGVEISEVEKIGQVGDRNFYKFLPTDYPPGELNPELYSESIDEMKRLERDYKKVKEMEDDIDSIVKTFKSIN